MRLYFDIDSEEDLFTLWGCFYAMRKTLPDDLKPATDKIFMMLDEVVGKQMSDDEYEVLCNRINQFMASKDVLIKVLDKN